MTFTVLDVPPGEYPIVILNESGKGWAMAASLAFHLRSTLAGPRHIPLDSREGKEHPLDRKVGFARPGREMRCGAACSWRWGPSLP